MTETWCIENDFAAQRELAATEEARGFREIEKLRARLAESEARVQMLEEALRKARDVSAAALERVDKLRAENKVLEATCQK